jgi:hypothetical protein
VYLCIAFHRPQVSGLMAAGVRLPLHDDETRCRTRFASENKPTRQSAAVSCHHVQLIT